MLPEPYLPNGPVSPAVSLSIRIRSSQSRCVCVCVGTAERRPVITLGEENPTPSIPLMRVLKGQYTQKHESFRVVSNKRKIFWRIWALKQLWGTIVFSFIPLKSMVSKISRTGLEQRVFLRVNCPFKVSRRSHCFRSVQTYSNACEVLLSWCAHLCCLSVYYWCIIIVFSLKGTVHPRLVLNLYELNTKEDILKNMGNQIIVG